MQYLALIVYCTAVFGIHGGVSMGFTRFPLNFLASATTVEVERSSAASSAAVIAGYEVSEWAISSATGNMFLVM